MVLVDSAALAFERDGNKAQVGRYQGIAGLNALKKQIMNLCDEDQKLNDVMDCLGFGLMPNLYTHNA